MNHKPPKLENLVLWRGTVTAVILAIIGGLVGLMILNRQLEGALWQIYVSTCIQVIGLGILMAAGPSRRWVSESVFTVVGVFLLAQIFINNEKLVLLPEAVPRYFEGYKLLALGTALIAAQSSRTGLLLITFCGILPLIQFFLWPAELRDKIGWEPALTLIYVMVSFGAYLYRIQSYKLSLAALRSEIELAQMVRAARIMMAAKDLANTPLQTLILSISLLKRDPSQRTLLPKMERALERLKQLTALLSSYDITAKEHGLESLSLDSSEMLQAEAESLENLERTG